MTHFMAKTGAYDQTTIVGKYDSAREAWDALADNAKDREDGNPDGFSAEVNMLEALARGEYEDFLMSKGRDEETGTPILVSGEPDEEEGIGILPGHARWYEVCRAEEVALGVVSEGTLRTEDLLRKFWQAIPTYEQIGLFNHPGHGDLVTAYSADTLFGEDRLEHLLDIFTQVLEGLAPEGYYFGNQEGDGACFGFWEDDDTVSTITEWKQPEAQSDWELSDQRTEAMASASFLMASWYVWGVIDFAPNQEAFGRKITAQDVVGFGQVWWQLNEERHGSRRTHTPSLQDAFQAYVQGEATNTVRRPAVGTTVYLYGNKNSPATIVQADSDGAIIREHDDLSETWFPWGELTTSPKTS